MNSEFGLKKDENKIRKFKKDIFFFNLSIHSILVQPSMKKKLVNLGQSQEKRSHLSLLQKHQRILTEELTKLKNIQPRKKVSF